TNDICLMADDDMIYVKDYNEVVQKAFEKHPEADMIVFNVRIHKNGKITEKVNKMGKINFFNSLKYGTVCFGFKREMIQKSNIYFSTMFGASVYVNGEDSIFIWECLKKGLKVYRTTSVIADVYNDDSTWFEGYTKSFFYDRGALFHALSPRFYIFLIFQFAVRKYKLYKDEISFMDSLKLMLQGAKEFL